MGFVKHPDKAFQGLYVRDFMKLLGKGLAKHSRKGLWKGPKKSPYQNELCKACMQRGFTKLLTEGLYEAPMKAYLCMAYIKP